MALSKNQRKLCFVRAGQMILIKWLTARMPTCRRSAFGVFAALLAVLCLGYGARAYAGLTITATFDSTITGDPNAANIEATINQAIATYQSTFGDPINVAIQFHEMTGGLGSSTTGIYRFTYSTFIAALTADAKSSNDAIALAHLPVGPSNPVTGSSFINVASANARAVGLSAAPFLGPGGPFDGMVGLNTQITN